MDEYSLDYWIKYDTFGMNENYKEKPDFIEANKFWSNKKNTLYKIYKDKPKVLEFINNITICGFYTEDDCYTVSAFIKLNYEIPHNSSDYYSHNYHNYLTLIYDPNLIISKQISLTEYDGFVYDMAMLLKYDYMLDTHDEDAIDKELYLDFIKFTCYNDITQEDFSNIFTEVFSYFSTKSNLKIKF